MCYNWEREILWDYQNLHSACPGLVAKPPWKVSVTFRSNMCNSVHIYNIKRINWWRHLSNSFIYLNPINFCSPLIFVQYECTKINSVQNRPFFMHLGALKLKVREFLKYHFRLKFDGIVQYFSRPWFYPIHLRVNKPEKENPAETCKLVLVSQVKSYKHKNLSVVSLTSENNTLKICILKLYGSLVIWL